MNSSASAHVSTSGLLSPWGPAGRCAGEMAELAHSQDEQHLLPGRWEDFRGKVLGYVTSHRAAFLGVH